MRKIAKLSETGERGLVIFDGEKYFAVIEEDWRRLDRYALPPPTSGDPVANLSALKAAVAVLAEDPQSVFVNLDQFTELKETKGSQADAKLTPTAPLPAPSSGRSIVLREGKSVVVVPDTEWQPIEGDVAGDAKVLVLRGAIAASIPEQDIPTGTFCVLVNFAGLLRG